MSKTCFVEEFENVASLGRLDCSFVELARRLRVIVEEELRKPCPDNAIITLLIDCAKMGDEHLRFNKKHCKMIWDRIDQLRGGR